MYHLGHLGVDLYVSSEVVGYLTVLCKLVVGFINRDYVLVVRLQYL